MLLIKSFLALIRLITFLRTGHGLLENCLIHQRSGDPLLRYGALWGICTHDNEISSFFLADQRVSTTQLYENGINAFVTLIEKWHQPGS